MFQTNNDADDLGDYTPHIDSYINEGYDRVIRAWTKNHIPTEGYAMLSADSDVPNVPEWIHPALANYATWLIYRNGNPQKQQRGLYYLRAFEEVLARISDEGGLAGMNSDGTLKQYRNFINIPG